jgi:cell division protein FtsB
MFDFQQKRRLRSILESRITWAILLVLTVVVLMSAYERYSIARDMADRRATAEAELERLRQRQTDLTERVEYLSNERGVEAEMRRQFDVALPGEQIVIIVDESSVSEEAIAATTTTTTPIRPWYRFW